MLKCKAMSCHVTKEKSEPINAMRRTDVIESTQRAEIWSAPANWPGIRSHKQNVYFCPKILSVGCNISVPSLYRLSLQHSAAVPTQGASGFIVLEHAFSPWQWVHFRKKKSPCLSRSRSEWSIAPFFSWNFNLKLILSADQYGSTSRRHGPIRGPIFLTDSWETLYSWDGLAFPERTMNIW